MERPKQYSTASALAATAVVTSIGVSLYLLWRRMRAAANDRLGGESSKLTALNGVAESPGAASKSTEEDDAERVYMYFGSQTGTAESFAKELGRLAGEKDIPTEVIDMEDFEAERFVKHRWVVLVLATYGEGDPTDNAVAFHKWLTSSERDECLDDMHLAIMGLGNRQYINFNEMAKKAEKLLSKMQAHVICKTGMGDDDQDIESDFSAWQDLFWPALIKARAADKGEELNAAELVRAASKTLDDIHDHKDAWKKRAPLELSIAPTTAEFDATHQPQMTGVDLASRFYFHSHEATVVVDRELRQQPDPEEGLSTHHVEVDISGCPELSYVTADNLDILPENPPELVQWFAERLGVKGQHAAALDYYIHLTPAAGDEDSHKRPFPTPCTLRDALTRYCDLAALPQKSALKDLACFVTDANELSSLEQLLSEHHKDDFKHLVKDLEMTLKEFVELFMTSAKFDLGAFLQLVTRNRPRPYTISSSSKEFSRCVSVTVSIVSHDLKPLTTTIMKLREHGYAVSVSDDAAREIGERPRRFEGICSTFLCRRLAKQHKLLVGVKPSTFRLPAEPSTPIIMVGAGTGIAPFRGFWREFAYENRPRGETALFFGCTHSQKDWVYRDEMESAAAQRETVLTHLVCAFSREQTHKVYVQHKLKEEQGMVKTILNNGGYVFVCGATAMGRSVIDALNNIMGEGFVDTLKHEHRWVEELWS
ncbi:unnamed protein product [Vitrella brassicaformis CCMP3155]|uniref:NADPH--hemoprotein reductase n=2 Tax=Vitrella brassicaformis TaxID=1169539 RepID=A0A0G4GHV1_VITBC|nr:unnamed protein product [Vitrella brassicaformis CCMP3155]|mmetsp:Transcript_38246/g.95771  ORF Transcript_38246/g.95771 Transcript_38246/m.95771 type:complete len:709 (+) Transcript_38246:98-2224(+)|eukprot:CEM29176.1 unnamed protein product [Vitrella brassicaformis CCMP3155]